MSFVYAIVAFIVGLLVGWAIWGRRSTPSTPAKPHVSGGLTDNGPTPTDATPRPHDFGRAADDKPAAVVAAKPEPEPVATPRPHEFGRADDDEPAATPKPHLSTGLDSDPAPAGATSLKVDDKPGPVAIDTTDDEPPTTGPSAAEPSLDGAEPVVTQPVATASPLAAPATAAPATAAPATAAPATAGPAVTEPVATASPSAEPVTAAPAAAEPAVTEPVATASPSADPVNAAPAVTEPVAEKTPSDTPAEPQPIAVVAAEPEPAAVVVPTQRLGVDDFKRLEGIGPKAAAALNAAGITSYGQLADADDAVIRAAFAAAGMRRPASAVTWPRQARLLADGDEAGFADLARSLKPVRPA